MTAKRGRKKITDKERLDWLLKYLSGSRSSNTAWHLEIYIDGPEKFTGGKVGYFRKAIDAAIRGSKP